MDTDKPSLRRQALELVAADGHRVGTRLAQSGGVSRQVANGYLQALVRDGLVDDLRPLMVAVFRESRFDGNVEEVFREEAIIARTKGNTHVR